MQPWNPEAETLDVTPGDTPEIFQASPQSQLAKTRLWLWVGSAIALVYVALTRNSSLASLGWAAGSLLLLCGIADFMLRRQLRPGRPLVALYPDGIESPSFAGRLLWKDMSGVAVELVQNVPSLQLQLRSAPGQMDKRSFWTGRNPSRPSIVLTPFSALDQERLFAAVQQRLQHVTPSAQASNPLLEERQFQDQLKALAPHTWVTYGLIAINVAVWGLMVAQGADVLKPSVELLLQWGGNATSEVQRGQWWRLLTAAFLHSGVVHLAMNMLGLWVIGQTVERIYGHRVFLLVYLGSALCGSALSLHFSAQKAVSVGASGAVFGLAGALLAAVFQHRKTLPKIFGKQMLSGMGFFVLYSLVQGFAQTGIDNAAHVGGLLAGALMAFILPERFDMAQYRAQLKPRAAAALVLALGLTFGLAVLAPPAALDIQRSYDGMAAFNRGMQGFSTAMKQLGQEAQQAKAGGMTEVEWDARGRSVHAPAFQKVQADLATAWLPPQDPRNSYLQEVRHFHSLVLEALAMASVLAPGSTRPEPVDPQRMAVLEAEMQKSTERMSAMAAQMQRKP
ncbi:rhomboid family intramembrane serine protease [Rhodoferax sp.]|uniref:rhomboid family intramembrane serine protease n=1 Tax=Rhodoferax sp. TaxID=50421 RepID=UPI00374D26EA